jgi:hypothetical protein
MFQLGSGLHTRSRRSTTVDHSWVRCGPSASVEGFRAAAMTRWRVAGLEPKVPDNA